MTSSVLILGSPADPHEQAVEKQLRLCGITPVYWSARHLLKSWHFNFELSNSQLSCQTREKQTSSTGQEPASCLNLAAFTAVWLRRPGKVESEASLQPWIKGFTERESNRALQSIYRMLPCKWINNPLAEHNSRFKLSQLQVAKEAGLSIPDTLVTNEPDCVRQFYAKHNGQVIYKLIDEGSNLLFPQHEVPPGIVTTPFSEQDLQHLDQVSLSLHLFQRRIPKVCDIRVTIVADSLFPVAIESQKGKGDTDFRLDYSVPMNLHTLPDAVSDQCRSLMKKLGLIYGAIDLCLDDTGNYYFFEVNSSGQWLWMEEALDLPISKRLAETLSGM